MDRELLEKVCGNEDAARRAKADSDHGRVGLGWTWGQLNRAQQNAAQIRQEAVSDIFRNLTCWPSTFGPCGNGCRRGSGRGSGPCIHCAQDQLASVTSADLAARFVAAVREARRLEAEVYETPALEANT